MKFTLCQGLLARRAGSPERETNLDVDDVHFSGETFLSSRELPKGVCDVKKFLNITALNEEYRVAQVE